MLPARGRHDATSVRRARMRTAVPSPEQQTLVPDSRIPDARVRAVPVPDAGRRSEIGGTLRGIALMCAGVCTFPFMNAAVKLLSGPYPVAEITWARFAGHLLVILAIFWP